MMLYKNMVSRFHYINKLLKERCPIINTLWTKESFYNKIQISKVRKTKIIENVL